MAMPPGVDIVSSAGRPGFGSITMVWTGFCAVSINAVSIAETSNTQIR